MYDVQQKMPLLQHRKTGTLGLEAGAELQIQSNAQITKVLL